MTTSPPAPRALYNLFWCTAPRMRTAAVATDSPATIGTLPPVEVIILYPAFLTPAVCSRKTAPGEPPPHFEMLLLGPEGLGSRAPGGLAPCVNRHVKISSFLDPIKWANDKPLFDEPLTPNLLEVAVLGKLDEGNPKWRDAIVRTEKLFRGRVDPRFWDAFDEWTKKRKKDAKEKKQPPPQELDTLFMVRVGLKCLQNAAPEQGEIWSRILEASAAAGRKFDPGALLRGDLGPAPAGLWETTEPQDDLIKNVMERRNGPDLRSGRGFYVNPGIHPDAVNLATSSDPVRAYHPLFVYDDLGFARIGHVADLHINSRQHFLARTPARVVEASPEAGASGSGAASSRQIGKYVNVYSDNALSIIEDLAKGEIDQKTGEFLRDPIDVLLVGGDLIDHVKNVYPYGWKKTEDLRAENVNAADIWEVLDLNDGDLRKKNYQAFVDHLTFYSLMKYFCETHQKPAFVVSGNHDAYEEPYGISPRPVQQIKRSKGGLAAIAGTIIAAPTSPAGLGAAKLALTPGGAVRANEGIPADHNLTFYEAILAFGESYYDTPLISALRIHPELFEWFYAVFTPFADFAVDLPKQRVLGLGWGSSEGKLLPTDLRDEHKGGHLPRADAALSDEQVALLNQVLDNRSKKVILFTHFTLVSYKNELSNFKIAADTRESKRALVVPREGSVGTSAFSKQDWGTFEKNRAALYDRLRSKQAGPGGGPLLHCVLTGHSHRRGLYYLGDSLTVRKYWTLDTRDRLKWLSPLAPAAFLPLPLAAAALLPAAPIAAAVLAKRVKEGVYETLMYPIGRSQTADALGEQKDRTPIIVSDSAGPVPRANIWNEFGEWGSDRPAGTFVSFSGDGVVTRVEPVRAEQARTRPRAAVAIDYLHVNDGHGIVSIVGDPFTIVGGYWGMRHTFELRFHDAFARASVQVVSATLYGIPDGGTSFDAVTLPADEPGETPQGPSPLVVLRVSADDSGKVVKILGAPPPRFMSLCFKALLPELDQIYDFVNGGRWEFEIDAEMDGPSTERRWHVYPNVESPDFKLRKKLFPDVYKRRPRS